MKKLALNILQVLSGAVIVVAGAAVVVVGLFVVIGLVCAFGAAVLPAVAIVGACAAWEALKGQKKKLAAAETERIESIKLVVELQLQPEIEVVEIIDTTANVVNIHPGKVS